MSYLKATYNMKTVGKQVNERLQQIQVSSPNPHWSAPTTPIGQPVAIHRSRWQGNDVKIAQNRGPAKPDRAHNWCSLI